MPAPEYPAPRGSGLDRGILSRDFAIMVVLLAGLCLAARTEAQGVPDIEGQPRLAIEAEDPSAPLGQEPESGVPPSTSEPQGPKAAAPKQVRPKHILPKGLAQRVGALAAKREYAKAIAVIDEALKTDSGNAELYRLRATVHCRARNLKLCLEDADRAIEADGEYVPARLFRASMRINTGQAKDALGDCDTVIKLQPASPLGYNCRGLANQALLEFSQAIADFDEALQRNARFALAHYNKGVTHVLQNRFEDAIASLTTAIEINPKYDDAFAQRGKARIGLNDAAGARADYVKAMSLNRSNFVAVVGMQALHVGKALDVLSDKK